MSLLVKKHVQFVRLEPPAVLCHRGQNLIMILLCLVRSSLVGGALGVRGLTLRAASGIQV